MTKESETTGRAYFSIGNGGIAFSVCREPEGKYGNGPHLRVHGNSFGTKMLDVDIETTPESLRMLALELFEAATESYPPASTGVLETLGSMPFYRPWSWENGREMGSESLEKSIRKRQALEKVYYEKAERLQKRIALLKAEAERLENKLIEHRRFSPKMWKRQHDGVWVDHDEGALTELVQARDALSYWRHDDPENLHKAVEGLTTLFRLVQCDDPWKMELSVIYGGGWPPGRWGEFEASIRQRAHEKGWWVGASQVLVRRHRMASEVVHVLAVSGGTGVIELEGPSVEE